ncbi:tRNA (adenosine(37)-N6)-threonylcarbamoyltransferase complex dimerization subunit type 1 TsaB [Thermodesulfatator atlanticus]|uniref:tRNA (adenosine(37)-N6)-threonylcarbamoyltransferase complex dimerization subunit type 1 TsaB n=1 Tax=Thermodesulfatator atlanticus TaxID=501497 RepID=UPI0003B79F42|nr:tRNA (adenosine(37)-N6)-threonylcarbamoyltransferase complex dimerization subunit type 1 TsaB [Thermodesulfatator atlanticus]
MLDFKSSLQQEKLVLAIETATPVGGVAIVGEKVLGEITLASAETHSRRLLSSAEFLLKRLGLSLSDLSAIGVSIGPGSFTGLRIGLATAKGLHFATGLPLIGVGTLLALAHQLFLTDKLVCAALDARRKQLYAALYKFEKGEPKEILPSSLLGPEKLANYIKEPVIFVGDGAEAFSEKLKPILGDKFLRAPAHLDHPRAANIGFVARKRFLSGLVDDPLKLLPIYLRPSEAELKRVRVGHG